MRDHNGDPVNPLDVLTDAEIAEDADRGAPWVREWFAHRNDGPWTVAADPDVIARRSS